MNKNFLIFGTLVALAMLGVIYLTFYKSSSGGIGIDNDPKCSKTVVGHEGNQEIVRIECK